MKITRKDKDKSTRFDCIPVGAVFEYEGKAYEKTYLPASIEYGAVDLENGTSGYFENKAVVTLLDAELIIRGELE